MLSTYHIRIKKDYAIAVLEDLQKMDALEFLPNANVPDWHITIVKDRLEANKLNPTQNIDFETAMDEIEKYL